jgi:hypothetical protein
VKKFSKFTSGVARLYASRVTVCPYWFGPHGELLDVGALASPTDSSAQAGTPPPEDQNASETHAAEEVSADNDVA